MQFSHTDTRNRILTLIIPESGIKDAKNQQCVFYKKETGNAMFFRQKSRFT